MATLALFSGQQYNDVNGVPLSGAQLSVYTANTTTPATSYQDNDLTTAHTNPVIADSEGRFPAIFLPNGQYKLVLANSSGGEQLTVDGYDTETELNSVAAIADAVQAVSTVVGEIPTVAANAAAITLVANNIGAVTTVNTNIADVNTVAAAVTLIGSTAEAWAASVQRDSFTGDGSTTDFTMSQAVSDEDHLLVFEAGVLRDPSTVSTSGTTLTLSPAPASSAAVDVRVIYAADANVDAKIDARGLLSESGTPDILAEIRDSSSTNKVFMQFLRNGGIKLLEAIFKQADGSDDFFALTDANKKRLFGVLRDAVEVWGMQVKDVASGDDLFQVVDASGNAMITVNVRGEFRWVEERLEARRVSEIGGRGAIMRVKRDRQDLYAYESNILGYTAPFVVNRYDDDPAHVYAADREIELHIDYGQSWRGYLDNSTSVAGLTAVEYPELVFGLADSNGVLSPSFYTSIADGSGWRFKGLNLTGTYNSNTPGADNKNGVGIGRVAAQVYQHLCLQNTKHVRGVVSIGCPRGGSWWTDAAATAAGSAGSYIGPGSLAWTAQSSLISEAQTVARDAYGLRPVAICVGFTHGAMSDAVATAAGETYRSHLDNMLSSYQGLLLDQGGSSLHIFTDQTPVPGTTTEGRESMNEQIEFAEANTDVVHCIGPRYPYAFRGDNIHTDAAGLTRVGELEALVKYKVLRLEETWLPCRITNIALAGSTLTITCSDPFGNGELVQDTTTIQAADSTSDSATEKGFRVKVAGSDATISSVSLSGLTITVELASAPTTGQSVEVSYAWYRPAGIADDANRAGAWGNFKNVGPASVLFSGETVDTWLCAHKETFTA